MTTDDILDAITDERLQGASYRQMVSLELALRYTLSEQIQRLQALRAQHEQVKGMLKGRQRPDSDSTDRTAS